MESKATRVVRVGLGLKSEKEGMQCGSYRGECGVSTGPAYKTRLWNCREVREVTCCPRFRSPACCLFLPVVRRCTTHSPPDNSLQPVIVSHLANPYLTFNAKQLYYTVEKFEEKKNTIKHNLFNFYCCSTCFQTTYSISPFLPPLFI